MMNQYKKQLKIFIVLRYALLAISIIFNMLIDQPSELRLIVDKYQYDYFTLIDEEAINIIYWIYTTIQLLILPIMFWKSKISAIYICLSLHLCDFIILYGGSFGVVSNVIDNLSILTAFIDGIICCFIYVNNSSNIMASAD
jgi:hypothetical protein